MINRAASEILGVDEQDVLHKRYDEAFAFIQLDPLRQLFRNLEEGQGRAEEEIAADRARQDSDASHKDSRRSGTAAALRSAR